jgi:hypothetical protein
VGTGTARTLVAAIGRDTDGDANVDAITTYSVAELANITGTGVGVDQIDHSDIIIF